MSFGESRQKQDAFCRMTSPNHLRKIGLWGHKGTSVTEEHALCST